MTTPSRSLNLQGATNFRDLGGYPAQDGRSVRWRRVFRSDHLAELTERDRAMLSEIGLARSLDFRGVNERAITSYHLPGVAQHSLSIEPTVVQNLRSLQEAGRGLTAQDAAAVMRETYRDFVHQSAPRFGEFFGHLLDADAPLVFHCTAGKDRTGFAAALFLLALGVSRPTVMEDFLLTNALYRRPAAHGVPDIPPDVQAVLRQVQQGYLETSLKAVDDDFGGLDAFLRRIGVGPSERERLAQMYLQP